MTPRPFPLHWPVGWPRTQSPEWSRFRVSLAAALDDLRRELDLLGATNVVASSNAVLLKSGEISSRQPPISDAGFAVYFDLDGRPRVIPCDRWADLAGNVRAIGLTVAALRGLDRWGTGGIMEAAFAGFAALPERATAGDAWWAVLGVAPGARPETVDAAYRALARRHHPDAGGDPDLWLAVQRAYEAAKEARS